MAVPIRTLAVNVRLVRVIRIVMLHLKPANMVAHPRTLAVNARLAREIRTVMSFLKLVNMVALIRTLVANVPDVKVIQTVMLRLKPVSMVVLSLTLAVNVRNVMQIIAVIEPLFLRLMVARHIGAIVSLCAKSHTRIIAGTERRQAALMVANQIG